jgi:hypothetical protein
MNHSDFESLECDYGRYSKQHVIHTYITITLYPRKGSRDLSETPTFYQNDSLNHRGITKVEML